MKIILPISPDAVMLARMLSAPVQSVAMAKDSRSPSDEVRYVAIMTREQRARFKYFCERIGAEMEQLGTTWIMDRLAEEERKLDRKR